MNNWDGIVRVVGEPKLMDFGQSKKVQFTVVIPGAGDKNDSGSYDGCFLDVEAWGENANHVSKNISDKDRIAISGKIKMHKWVDSTSNDNRYKIYVNATYISFPLDSPRPSVEDQEVTAPLSSSKKTVAVATKPTVKTKSVTSPSDEYDPFAED